MAAGTGARPGTGGARPGTGRIHPEGLSLREGIHPEQLAPEQAHLGKAARLRRLWRSQDMRLRSSGLARARPLLAAPAEALLPSRGLTARELINMARAARAAGSLPTR